MVPVITLPLGPYNANCYIVGPPEATAVIDPGDDDPQLMKTLEDRHVLYILNTHCHPDHIGGIAAVKQRTGARLLFHPDDRQIFSYFLGEGLVADGEMHEGEIIKVDALEFQVWHTPGHSPGSVTLREERERVLFSGDLLFAGSIGRTDLPGGSYESMRKSLKRVMQLSGDYRVYPGHGPETTLAEERWTNPFLMEIQSEL